MDIDFEAEEMVRIRTFLASVRAGVGHPEDPRQKGKGGFFPGLTARPWHDAGDFASTRTVTDVLEGQAATILAEYRAARQESFLVPHPASNLHPAIEGRDWGFYEIWQGGAFREDAQARFPATCGALSELVSFLSPAGQVAFHCLQPGAKLRPHVDGPNTTLTCHLGVDVPPDCGLRVAGTTRTWRDGRCLWFDHSYEHEAWNRSDRPRTILLLDVLHPDITPFEAAVWRHMFRTQHGLA